MDKMRFTFVELPKFSKSNTTPVEKRSLEEKFYYFLHHAPEMEETAVKALIGKDDIIGKAFKELDPFFCTEAELLRYEAAEKRDRDHRAMLAKAVGEIKRFCFRNHQMIFAVLRIPIFLIYINSTIGFSFIKLGNDFIILIENPSLGMMAAQLEAGVTTNLKDLKSSDEKNLDKHSEIIKTA